LTRFLGLLTGLILPLLAKHFACRTDPANVTGMASATLECILNVPPSLHEEMYAALHSAPRKFATLSANAFPSEEALDVALLGY
jgi:hypothetical protein